MNKQLHCFIDEREHSAFLECAREADLNASQLMRKLVRDYLARKNRTRREGLREESQNNLTE